MRALAIGALAVAAGVLGAMMSKHGGATVPFAKEDYQEGCDPTVKRGVAMFRAAVLKRFGGSDGGIPRQCHIGGKSEHKEGRAWDWMTITNSADPDAFFEWLFANDSRVAREAGIMYMVFKGRKWEAWAAGDKWRAYGGSNPHNDHVHISFSWDGALAKLPWYAGQPEPDMRAMIT